MKQFDLGPEALERGMAKLDGVRELADDLRTLRESIDGRNARALAAYLWDGNFDILVTIARVVDEAIDKKHRTTHRNELEVDLESVTIIPGDLRVERDVCNGGALIVLGNVDIGGLYWDRDVGCLLICLGSVRVNRTNIYGGTRISGDLDVPGALFGIDHSDSIFVVGTVRSPLVILEEKGIYAKDGDIGLLVGDHVTTEKKLRVKKRATTRAVLEKYLLADVLAEEGADDGPIDLKRTFERLAREQRIFRYR